MTATYEVRNAGKRLEVAALDLRGTLDEVLGRVEVLAGVIREVGGGTCGKPTGCLTAASYGSCWNC